MAATYIPIASTTLSSTAASVTFSSIPATYTDLVLKWSARSNAASTRTYGSFRFNSSSASEYSARILVGNGSSVLNDYINNSAALYSSFLTVGSTATSNTFSNGELYIPNYLASNNKPVSIFSTNENNASDSYIVIPAGLWRNTNAISSITMYAGPNASPTDSFVSGSTFHLYGISNT